MQMKDTFMKIYKDKIRYENPFEERINVRELFPDPDLPVSMIDLFPLFRVDP